MDIAIVFIVQLILFGLFKWDQSNSNNRQKLTIAKMMKKNLKILEMTRNEKEKNMLLLKQIKEHEENKE